MRVAFACVKKTRLHASSLQQTRIHALYMQVIVMLSSTAIRSCWLKFSNMATMMALQLFSEHRKFSDYSNHMTIIYLRQIGIYETLTEIFFPTVPISSPATKLTIVSNYAFRVVVAESSLFDSGPALKSAIHVS